MEFLKAFLGGAGGAAIVAGLFGVIQWCLGRKAQKEDKATAKQESEDTRHKDDMMEIIRYLVVLFVGVWTFLYDRLKLLS